MKEMGTSAVSCSWLQRPVKARPPITGGVTIGRVPAHLTPASIQRIRLHAHRFLLIFLQQRILVQSVVKSLALAKVRLPRLQLPLFLEARKSMSTRVVTEMVSNRTCRTNFLIVIWKISPRGILARLDRWTLLKLMQQFILNFQQQKIVIRPVV